MRFWMTGGTGFVGSNIVHRALPDGHEVLTTFNSYRRTGREPYLLEPVNMPDASAVPACEVFDLDPELVRSGPPDPAAMPGAPIRYDTTLTSPRTSELPERNPTPVRRLLERFRDEYRAGS